MTSEFDRYASSYEAAHQRSVARFGEETQYFAAYKAADVRRLATGQLAAPRVLDFGTGIGGLIPHIAHALPGAKITGVDVSRECLSLARSRHGGIATFILLDGKSIPVPSGSIDVAVVSCVMHHMARADRFDALSELRRVLTPAGKLVIFEHNPWNPLTRRAVRDCEFDTNAELVSMPVMLQVLGQAGFSVDTWEFRVFFPALLAAFRPLERYLKWLPAGAQYLVVAQPR